MSTFIFMKLLSHKVKIDSIKTQTKQINLYITRKTWNQSLMTLYNK